ncbi:MAG: hypothetical protein ABIQ73_01040, partial [Acidimicrobiales bacterium]
NVILRKVQDDRVPGTVLCRVHLIREVTWVDVWNCDHAFESAGERCESNRTQQRVTLSREDRQVFIGGVPLLRATSPLISNI